MDAISGLSESLFSKSKQTRQQAGIFLTFITLVVVRLCNFALLCVTFIAFCFCVSQDWIWVALAGLCSAALQRCVPIHSMGCTNRGGWRRKKEKGSGMKNKREKRDKNNGCFVGNPKQTKRRNERNHCENKDKSIDTALCFMKREATKRK